MLLTFGQFSGVFPRMSRLEYPMYEPEAATGVSSSAVSLTWPGKHGRLFRVVTVFPLPDATLCSESPSPAAHRAPVRTAQNCNKNLSLFTLLLKFTICSETVSHYVAQASFLPQPAECWHYRHASETSDHHRGCFSSCKRSRNH